MCVISGARRACCYYCCLSGALQCGAAQVWVGVDIHWLLNDSVICVVGLSAAQPRKAVEAGNCCGGRLGFVLGWVARCCPILSLPLSFLLSVPPFHPVSLMLYPLIALFERGME